MSEFKATVEIIDVQEHHNADALEVAVIGGYRSIVKKGMFKSGQYAVYIPEAAVLPEWLISRLGLEGRLAGKDKNRVKAVKLRGVLSQGLVYPLGGDRDEKWPDAITHYIENETSQMGIALGDDVTEFLGITKYEPPIPTSMNGQVFNAHGMTLKYDIENIKRHPKVLRDQEVCVVTEKLHGTWACFGYHPDAPHPIVTSKGMSGQGLAFKFVEENNRNLYVRAFREHQEALEKAKAAFPDRPVYILGEIFGKGVQDLTYGFEVPQFRVFDIYIGEPGQGDWMPPFAMKDWVPETLGLETVPVLHAGPVDKALIERLTDGNETVGEGSNIREGIVITPMFERRDDEIGRVKVKSVSEAYLLRKGGTELQ